MSELSSDIRSVNELIEKESVHIDSLVKEMGRVIIGQKDMIDLLILGLISNGHILLEGMPGLAKTLAVKTLSDCIDGEFHRIQFTPDLLPADITGTQVYSPKKEEFYTRKGPVFANFILADEINRSPAKVQSALLEAMQERQVTIGEETFKLGDPFMVLATQNPIEQEGTYPLPEAQLDRFMFKLNLTYPKKEDEILILKENLLTNFPKATKIIEPKKIIGLRNTSRMVYIDPKIENYIVDMVRCTRNPQDFGLKDIKNFISFGASPRASINIGIAAKAFAFSKKRGFVIPEDVRAVSYPVLRHRIGLTYEAEAEKVTQDKIITEILNKIEVP